MSFDKIIRQYRNLLINPRPNVPPVPSPSQVFMRIFNFFRKRLLVIFLFTIMTMILIGFLVPEGTFSVYSDFGITSGTVQPTGIFWDLLWWIRGQPAGWQTPQATGYFAVTKLTTDFGSGFNGPLNPIALLFEFIVDFVIYIPKFLNPSWVISNVDMIPGFMIKMIIDVGAMGVFVMIVIPVFGVLVFFSPIIVQRLWLVSGPLFKIILLAGFILFAYLLLTGRLDSLIDLILGFGS
jgi:hypothetical protein